MSDVFDLLDRPLVWIEVRWPGLKPGPEGGLAEEVEHVIELQVEVVDRDRLIELFALEEGMTPVDDLTAFRELVKDWRKIVAAGNPLPFEEANIKRLLALPSFSTSLQAAYLGACAGKAKLREGNSEGSRVNGRAGDSAEPKPNRQQRRATPKRGR